jgi:hypothetical protein
MAFTFVSQQNFCRDPAGGLPDIDHGYMYGHNWSPIVGIGRPVILSDVSLYFLVDEIERRLVPRGWHFGRDLRRTTAEEDQKS